MISPCPSCGDENDVPCPRCGRTWRGQHAQWCMDAVTAENDAAVAAALHEQHANEFPWMREDDFTADQCGNCQRWARYALAARVFPPAEKFKPGWSTYRPKPVIPPGETT